MRLLRVLGYIIAVLVGVVLIVLAVSVVLSPPWAGKKLADELAVPHRAVIAHRGASGLAPEGTAPAYLLAREMGVDYLEADLQRTKDGVIVVYHDDTLARTTDVAQVFPGRENDTLDTFTYEELMHLDAGSWFNVQFPDKARDSFAGLRILTLEQLADIAAGATGPPRPGLYLETKSPERHPGYEEAIVDILTERGWLTTAQSNRGAVVFQSFDAASLGRLAQLSPTTPRILLISTEIEAEHGWNNLLDTAMDVGHGVGPIGFLGWPWNTGPAHRRGLIVHPYVINATWQMRLLTFFGVDGFFTDHPEKALPLFGRGPVDEEKLWQAIGY